MSATYRITDEPHPTGLAEAATNPIWPLLASMLGGVWLGWPWLALNSFALGSPTRARELMALAGGTLGSALIGALIYYGTIHLLDSQLPFGLDPRSYMKFAIIPLLVWKLAFSYWVFTLQIRTFSLHQHFGGTVRNGLPVLIVGALVSGTVFRWMFGLSVILGLVAR